MDLVLRLPIEEKRPTSNAMDYALTVVETMGEQGLTTVPIKPTTAMLTAGARPAMSASRPPGRSTRR